MCCWNVESKTQDEKNCARSAESRPLGLWRHLECAKVRARWRCSTQKVFTTQKGFFAPCGRTRYCSRFAKVWGLPGEGGQQICSGCESFNQLRDPRLARHPVTQTHTHICSDHLNFAVVAFSNLAASLYYPLLLPQSRHPASTIAAASCSSFLFAPFAIWLRNYGCTCSLS